MRTLPLNTYRAVQLDASGNGTASAGPSLAGETWTAPVTVAVRASTNVKEAQCSVYAGWGIDQSTFQDTTTWGSSGDSDNSVSVTIHPGMYIFAVWTGGDAHAQAVMVVTGSREVP